MYSRNMRIKNIRILGEQTKEIKRMIPVDVDSINVFNGFSVKIYNNTFLC